MKATSWGRIAHQESKIIYPDIHIAEKIIDYPSTFLAYGNGRSYGDVCLNPDGNLLSLNKFNKFLAFDRVSGVIECQSGILLKEIQELIYFDGWILPVTPGTQLITLGGAIANDVHGKNHHVFGNFGHHIVSLVLIRSDGEILKCDRNVNSDLFYATIGGFGMTGVILSAKINLKKISTTSLRIKKIYFNDLSEFLFLSDLSEQNDEFTVGWIDSLNKNKNQGIFSSANWVSSNLMGLQKIERKSLVIPSKLSFNFVNTPFVKFFNWAYLRKSKVSRSEEIQHFTNFLYPLDSIANWNLIYGKKGFYQYQCVIPFKSRLEGLNALLSEIKKFDIGSFLTVIKTFSKIKSLGMMSFPIHGATIALDFPNYDSKIDTLFANLDSIVSEHDGRVYLAKDAKLNMALFRKMYPNYEGFLKFRDLNISSNLSRRLLNV